MEQQNPLLAPEAANLEPGAIPVELLGKAFIDCDLIINYYKTQINNQVSRQVVIKSRIAEEKRIAKQNLLDLKKLSTLSKQAETTNSNNSNTNTNSYNPYDQPKRKPGRPRLNPDELAPSTRYAYQQREKHLLSPKKNKTAFDKELEYHEGRDKRVYEQLTSYMKDHTMEETIEFFHKDLYTAILPRRIQSAYVNANHPKHLEVQGAYEIKRWKDHIPYLLKTKEYFEQLLHITIPYVETNYDATGKPIQIHHPSQQPEQPQTPTPTPAKELNPWDDDYPTPLPTPQATPQDSVVKQSPQAPAPTVPTVINGVTLYLPELSSSKHTSFSNDTSSKHSDPEVAAMSPAQRSIYYSAMGLDNPDDQ